MISCVINYKLNETRLADFETYATRWIYLLEKFGATVHGYFLPSEGVSDLALLLFSFPSLAEYEQYRVAAKTDPEVLETMKFAADTECFLRHERSFFRPLLRNPHPGSPPLVAAS